MTRLGRSFPDLSGFRVLLAASIAAALAIGGASPSVVRALSPITVDTTAGGTALDGHCSLAEAIVNANNDFPTMVECITGSGTDTINFADSLGTATIVLTDFLPAITDADGLTIDGGRDITVDGNSNAISIFHVSAPTTIQDLTVANGGGGPLQGGGATVDAGVLLTIVRSTFYGNLALSGGGVYSAGLLDVHESAFISNNALGTGGGDPVDGDHRLHKHHIHRQFGQRQRRRGFGAKRNDICSKQHLLR